MTAPARTERRLVGQDLPTVLVVLYSTPVLDLSALPRGSLVVLVHNDGSLREVRGDGLRISHVRPGGNVGFGAGVNAGLEHVSTSRVLLCNPDVRLQPEHWQALAAPAAAHEVVTLPQVDAAGAPGSTVNRYPGPLVTLLQLASIGRLAPRGSLRRRALTRLLGSYGTSHRELLDPAERRLRLSEHWASGSLLSLDCERLRAIGGFDEEYFLYVEDVDLCHRLAAAYPDSELVVRPIGCPVLHAVGGSAGDLTTKAMVRRERLRSAQLYSRNGQGFAWALARFLLRRAAARAEPSS